MEFRRFSARLPHLTGFKYPMLARIFTKQSLLFVAKVAVSSTLLLFLFSKLGSAAVLEALSRADVTLLAFSTALLIGQTALSAWKWQLLLRQQGVDIRFLPLLKIYLISNFINLFMPSIVIGDAYRASQLRRYTASLQGALPSIIVDRGSGLAALLIIGALGLTSLYWPDYVLLAIAAIVIFTLAMYALLIGPIARRAAAISPKALFGLPGVLVEITRSLRPSQTLLWVVILSFVFQFNTVLINWVYCVALNIPVEFRQLLTAVPAVYLLEMLPISINGVGLREGAFSVLFAQMGIAAHYGLALGLTITVMRYVAGIVGGVLLAIDTLSGRATRAAPEKF